jgi:hypothetical protein
VNGQAMLTEALYQHPELSILVSNEGPVRVTRYPSNVAPASAPARAPALAGIVIAPREPRGGLASLMGAGLDALTRGR